MNYPIISADSHITEPPGTYIDRIDPKFRDRAPRMQRDEKAGDLFVIDGMRRPVAMGLVAAAGKPPEEITITGVLFDELHRGGWDPNARLAEQDILSAEAAQSVHDEVRAQVEEAVAFAKASPMPEPSALLEDVYA